MAFKQLHFNTLKITACFAFLAMIVLVMPVMGQSDDTVYVWYGNIDGSPVDVEVGQQFELDVYINTGGVYTGDAYICSGARTLYITSRQNEEFGQVYYPFIEWDVAEFVSVDYYPDPDSTWFSEPFFGIANWISLDNPWLFSPIPIRVLSEALTASDDPSLAGQTVNAFGQGFHYAQGETNFGDTLGNINYQVFEYFSQLHFIGATTITGVVTNQADNPIENVAVFISQTHNYYDTTDAAGEYLISGINPGMTQVSFSHPDYRDTVVEYFINEGAVNTVDLVMVSSTVGNLEGTVTDSSGLPLSDVAVNIIGTSLTSQTDNDGFYRIENITAGNYSVQFAKSGYQSTLITDIIISNGLTATVDAALAILISDEPLMHPNYPNPFNNATKISFYLPAAEPVKVIIYDILGRKVATIADMQGRAGLNIVTWDGEAESAGVYFCRIKYRGKDYTRSLIKF